MYADIYNASAQLLFCSLNLSFGDVPVAAVVVVCLSSLIGSLRNKDGETRVPERMSFYL